MITEGFKLFEVILSWGTTGGKDTRPSPKELQRWIFLGKKPAHWAQPNLIGNGKITLKKPSSSAGENILIRSPLTNDNSISESMLGEASLGS